MREIRVPRHALDMLALATTVVIILWLGFLTSRVFLATEQIRKFAEQQLTQVQVQNEQQLCVQHDIILAVRQIGTKLGLDVSDIRFPSVRGLPCAP